MRVAIVGGGISGLSCAWMLHSECDITVFEADDRIGGHSNTVSFPFEGQQLAIDTGFIVYNDRNYPLFSELLDELQVHGRKTAMSFAVRCDRSSIEYCGSSLDGLFAQRRNLLRPTFLKMVADILRFNKQGLTDADTVNDSLTVGEYLTQHGFGKGFCDLYLLPMGAAIWSCPTGTFRDFPIRFILEFYRNHGLLSLTNRPQWFTIPNGSRSYVSRLTHRFRDRIRLSSAVTSITRMESGVRITTAETNEIFDEVILACHSDQALAMLTDASPTEREVLSAFPYQMNDAVLHYDTSVLPRRRKAWAAWNYRIDPARQQCATVTYNMNILQHIEHQQTFSVTLNDTENIAESKIISRHKYAHPVFTTDRAVMQQRHAELIRANRTSFCGAYWGNGFHEDGVASAVAVCRKYGVSGVRLNSNSDRKIHVAQEASPVEGPPNA